MDTISLDEARRQREAAASGPLGDDPPPMEDDGETPPKLPPLDITEAIALAGKPVPLRRWLVEGWAPWRQTVLFYGDGGTGKSLLAMQLGTCCAANLDFLGLPTMPCRVFMVLCEDDNDELHIRQNAINHHYGLSFGDLENLRWVSRVGEDNTLMTFDSSGNGRLTAFWHQVEEAAKDFGAQLVIIDTAADTYGGDENIRRQVRAFIQVACTRLARAIDGAVILLAHPSAAGLASGRGDGGSTGWSNSVRSRWFLSRPKAESGEEEDTDLRILSKKKSNYGSVGDEITIRWNQGAFEVVGGKIKDKVDRIEDSRRDDEFIGFIRQLQIQGLDGSAKVAAKNYAPKAMKRLPTASAWTIKELEATMNRLLAAGTIRNVVYGPPSRGWTHLEVVSDACTGSL